MTTDPDITAAARALGRRGGAAKSKAKATAARANGRKGGRPRSDRKARAMAALNRAKTGGGLDAVDAWVDLATPGEIRRHWCNWMGAMPEWARQ